MDDPLLEKISTKYYEPYELTPLMESATNNLSFFHLNKSSLCFHIEELTTINESLLKLNKSHLNSVKIPEYKFEFTPTECNIAIYIKKD